MAEVGISVSFSGLEALHENFRKSPQVIEEEVNTALGLSLAEVEHQAKIRTPVDTGYLQGSIGGEGGYKYVTGLTAGVGTNVQYSVKVETDERAKHKVGQAHYMEHGVEAANPFIEQKMQEAMERVGERLTQGL